MLFVEGIALILVPVLSQLFRQDAMGLSSPARVGTCSITTTIMLALLHFDRPSLMTITIS